ncbi:transcriptional regulator [Aeromonas veronii]
MMKNVEPQIKTRYLVQDEIVFDPFRNEIVFGDASYKLAYSDTKVLHLLINSNGSEVTREEIINYAWHGRIVTEASLTTSISTLRKILRACNINEDGILTVPKIGYKFTLDVKVISFDEGMPLTPNETAVEIKNNKYKSIQWFNLLLALFILAFTFLSITPSPLENNNFISSEYKNINVKLDNKQYRLLVKRNEVLPKYLNKLVLLSPENSFVFFSEEKGVINLSYFFKNKSKTYTFEKQDIERASEVIYETIDD